MGLFNNMQVKQTGEMACKGRYPGHYSALKAEEVEVSCPVLHRCVMERLTPPQIIFCIPVEPQAQDRQPLPDQSDAGQPPSYSL